MGGGGVVISFEDHDNSNYQYQSRRRRWELQRMITFFWAKFTDQCNSYYNRLPPLSKIANVTNVFNQCYFNSDKFVI